MTPAEIAAVADHLCALVQELTAHRRGAGPHWVMVAEVARELGRHGIDCTDADLQDAIALCRQRHVIKAEGRPAHSISPWQKDWSAEAAGRARRR